MLAARRTASTPSGRLTGPARRPGSGPPGPPIRAPGRNPPPWVMPGQSAAGTLDRKCVATGSWLTMPDDQTPTTDHPAEGVNLPLPGIQTAHDIEDAEEHLLTGGADLESNELHASGRTCARCGQRLLPDEDVRRTVDGAYQHEFCQPR